MWEKCIEYIVKLVTSGSQLKQKPVSRESPSQNTNISVGTDIVARDVPTPTVPKPVFAYYFALSRGLCFFVVCYSMHDQELFYFRNVCVLG